MIREIKSHNIIKLTTYLVHYREIDVGEASEPEGCSSRSLSNSITRAVITDFTD